MHRPLASARARQATESLRVFGLSFPGSFEDHPWGEIALKVGREVRGKTQGKVFAFLGGNENGGVGLSVKLPRSQTSALDQPFTQPTGYGLGKHGWVTAQFAPDENVPLELLRAWIDESYRAVAPKTLVAQLEANQGAKGRAGPSARAAPADAPARAARKAPRKKTTSRTPARPAAGSSRKKRARG